MIYTIEDYISFEELHIRLSDRSILERTSEVALAESH